MRNAMSSGPLDPPGKVVTLTALPGEGYRVDPPPGAAEPSRTFFAKGDAFTHARTLWTKYRCGLTDHTENMRHR
jgi:hypothetical protein